MTATEHAFLADVNVSIATGNGRFSAVDQWPVLGIHRGSASKWHVLPYLTDEIARNLLSTPETSQ
jgi:hypothetical protein